MITTKKLLLDNPIITVPMFHTIESMSKVSGIGENTLRALVDERQIAHLRIGNKRLLTVSAVYDWYEKSKIPVS